jgi:TRAP-type C4-dicarboxylate transport system substrate-binding protein
MRNAVREAVAWQRDVHETEETEARKAIEAQGCKITEDMEDSSKGRTGPP